MATSRFCRIRTPMRSSDWALRAAGFAWMDGHSPTRKAGSSMESAANSFIRSLSSRMDGRPATAPRFATATNFDGTAAVSSCNNWTNGVDTGDQAVAGLGEGGPWEWNEGVSIICGEPIPLICMGITKSAAVTVPSPGPGRKIWLSSTRFTPGTTTTPDALCQATLPPGVTTAAALIATTTKTAASLLVPATSYYHAPTAPWSGPAPI